RRHLFSNITISVGRGIGRFGDLFHSPHATITPFVKSLSLIAEGAQCSTNGEQSEFLIQLLSKLRVVPFRTFSLKFKEQGGYVLRKDPLSAQARGFVSSYRTVVNLRLHCEFSTITDLVELICSLPLLEVADLSVQIHESHGDPQHRPPSTLRKVILWKRFQPILDWISDITPDHSISDIVLNYDPHSQDPKRISQFLPSQGNKLTNLTLTSSWKSKPYARASSINISSNGGLSRLELHYLSPDDVEGILNSVSTSSPVEIAITFGSFLGFMIGDLINKLDSIFSEPRHDRLKSLAFETRDISGTDPDPDNFQFPITLTTYNQWPSKIAPYSNHSEFPAEIVDLFLDDCQQDAATLISSSLVRRFGDLFHSPHATITPLVKSLSLIAAGAQCSTDGEQRSLIQLLSKLRVVPFRTFSLKFEGRDGYVLRKNPLSAQARGFMSSYRTVVNLCLHCEFRTITDLVELICSLPLLEVGDLSVQIHESYGDPQHRPPSTLRKVILWRRFQPILDWISDITPDHSISDIILNYDPDFQNSGRISQFLASQGNKLTHLTLELSREFKRYYFPASFINISSNGGLGRLELHNLSPDDVESILNSVSTSSPVEIAITFGLFPDYIIRDLTNKFDSIFSEPRYDHLRSLAVSFSGRDLDPENTFPHCWSRGILTGFTAPPEIRD
ncbi:uncharacterized protein LACBIDRAFT_336292, partial [Laccaria bicolor S238N-H82]